jgi:hypothetical protein
MRRVLAHLSSASLPYHFHSLDCLEQTLGPRIGYLPLLIPVIKAHFSNALPPGVDTVWFEYKGLPLKW